MNKIEDDQYKPDLELLDRYVQYSAEMLRIALLVIGAIGTLTVLKDNFRIALCYYYFI